MQYRSVALGSSAIGTCQGTASREGFVTEIRRLTEEQMASFGYTVAELRQLARERGVLVPRDALHHEIVRALTAAGVGLPRRFA